MNIDVLEKKYTNSVAPVAHQRSLSIHDSVSSDEHGSLGTARNCRRQRLAADLGQHAINFAQYSGDSTSHRRESGQSHNQTTNKARASDCLGWTTSNGLHGAKANSKGYLVLELVRLRSELRLGRSSILLQLSYCLAELRYALLSCVQG